MSDGPGPGPIAANNQNPNPFQAALYRFIGAFFALAFAVGILLLVPGLGPELKVILIGLAGAAVLSIEEYIKSQKGL